MYQEYFIKLHYKDAQLYIVIFEIANGIAVRDFRTGVRSICILVPMLGVTWLFGLLSVNDDVIAFQYIFSILNSLQVNFHLLL
jgi:hypothetical protein